MNAHSCPASVTAIMIDARCPDCGYDLRGTTGHACPECGGCTDPFIIDMKLRRRQPSFGLTLVGTTGIAVAFVVVGQFIPGDDQRFWLWIASIAACACIVAIRQPWGALTQDVPPARPRFDLLTLFLLFVQIAYVLLIMTVAFLVLGVLEQGR